MGLVKSRLTNSNSSRKNSGDGSNEGHKKTMSHWGYCKDNGPQTWPEHYPEAGGKHQSPVDIKPVDLKILECNKPLQWKYTPDDNEELKNTGHGWRVTVKQGGSSLSGGPVQGVYELAQFHCHWGQTDDQGSEHTINGKTFAGELHLVHWNSSKYKTMDEAVKHPDGLCVLGVLLKQGAKNQEIQKIVAQLGIVEYKDQTTSLPEPVDLAKIIPEDGSCGYYTYQGSLTTPPCSECVIWVVFKAPIEVSDEQLKSFRHLKSIFKEEPCTCKDCNGEIPQNFRPTLPLNHRDILEGH